MTACTGCINISTSVVTTVVGATAAASASAATCSSQSYDNVFSTATQMANNPARGREILANAIRDGSRNQIERLISGYALGVVVVLREDLLACVTPIETRMRELETRLLERLAPQNPQIQVMID